MISDKIKEQKFAVQVLKAHIEQKRLAPTYLMTGGKGSGKEELALAFACALHCSEEKYFKECECRVCSKIKNRNHPDVRWVGDSTARSIKIEEIRDLISWAALKPYEGEWKIFILTGADRLTLEASNALLKTLEEPPEHTVFFLLVESKAQMLETIQSRSFEIRLRPLAEEALPDEKERIFPGPGENNWEDFLESFQSVPRDELKQNLDALMSHFRDLIYQASLKQDSERLMASGIEALDAVYESKMALDENVNQKLALSRLAMQLRKATSKVVLTS